MRRSLSLLLLFLLLLFPSCGREEGIALTFDDAATLPEDTQTPEEVPVPMTSVAVLADKAQNPPVNADDTKAIWLSQYDLSDVYLEGNRQRSRADFTVLAETIFQNIADAGFNTVYLQVRPNADSFYPSKIYPPSRYVVGEYGKDFSYDPLDILVELAHACGLSIHAWINPLRGMTVDEVASVPASYPIRALWDDPDTRGTGVVAVEGRLYLNPAYPDVRVLILAGAREILENYHVDGLHMDDYFYPTTDESFDAQAYADYLAGGGTLSLADFRRDSLNRLVSSLYALTKGIDPGLRFTVSPAGNLDAVYENHYADVYAWGSEEGYVDAIIPQIYFGFDHETHPFDTTLLAWDAVVTHPAVELHFGLTFEKAESGTDPYAGTGENEWTLHKDVLSRALAFAQGESNACGVACFSYSYLFDPVTGKRVEATQTELDAFLPLLQESDFS